MKNPSDPRHQKRQHLVQELFKVTFHKQRISNTAKEILDNTKSIDQSITQYAPEYPIEKINRVDLAILRLAVYELTIAKKEPPNVIIDEAVELAKEFGGDASPSFINGVLGAIIHHEKTTKISK